MKFVEHWWTVATGAASNWTVLVTSFIVGAVAQAHMAMFAFLAFLPWLPAQIVGGGLVLALLIAGPTIVARVTRQTKLTAKIEAKSKEASDAQPGC